MKSNLTLIGMPGAGKSTIGIILAKFLSLGFIDTDVLIQISQQKSLQQIIDESDYLTLRKIEEKEILKLNIENHVIATGGSAAYSEKAMTHLLNISKVIFLKVDYELIKKRIHNLKTRGIAKAKNQTFRDLYNERQVLYNKYAEITTDCNKLDQEEIAEIISMKCLQKNNDRPRIK
jgi:shikimate kinase